MEPLIIVKWLSCILVLFKFAAAAEDTSCAKEQMKECNKITDSCNSCLQSSACCSWCLNSELSGPRCDVLSELKANKCSDDYILIGGKHSVLIMESSNLTDTNGSQEAVQIKPKQIKIRIRKGEVVTFNFTYRAAKNYPIQLYYLMDLTNSMKAHKESLVKIGKDVGDLLRNLTKNYQLAFGYYADKVAMPFYKMTPADVQNPCGMLYGETCDKGFAFVHAQDFTKDIETFVQKVKESKFTSNLDDLENGLEPIIQILECDQQVSWLKTSRKMIVMATNSLLHMAGDGILAGVTKKHPGGCILNEKGVLEDYLAYDYPSLEEIGKALETKKVQLILTGAVKDGTDNNPIYEAYYREINELMPDVSVFVNNRQIIENIKAGYEQVTKKIFFRDNNTRSYLDIKYTSTCNKTEDYTAYCFDTQSGNEYTFFGSVQLLEEVPEGKNQDIILISESNIEESLQVIIEYIVNKDCDCKDSNKDDCSGHGTFQCGKCICNKDGWYGSNCSKKCTVEDNCRFSNTTYTSTTCNSSGECDLEKCACACDDQFSGDFCEYLNCEKNTLGLICSGHGKCKDGKCQCYNDSKKNNYTGEICDCSQDTDNCIRKDNDKGPQNDGKKVLICEGHGECICNKCVCSPGLELVNDPDTQLDTNQTVSYIGDYCQNCLNCTHTCSKYKNCIVANVQNILKEAYCNPNYPPQIEQKDREYGDDSCLGEYYNHLNQLCSSSFILENNFIYYKDQGCPGVQAAGFYLIGLPILAIILMGLLALVSWKAIIMRKDKTEFAKFQKEKEQASFNLASPLYKSPVSSFKNPIHRDNRFD